MTHTTRIPQPKTEQDFESMCAHIYGVVYNCTLPIMYGRKGQAQHGLDIVFQKNNDFNPSNRIGFQCKHVQNLSFDGKSGDTIKKEVDKADNGKQKITLLVIGTTLPSDKNLIDAVKVLSDERMATGKFAVELQFWGDIENKIIDDINLARRYQKEDFFAKYLLEDANKLYEQESYSAAIQRLNLEENQLSLLNIEEKYKRLILLAKNGLALERHSEFNSVLEELLKYEWDDDSVKAFEVIKLWAVSSESAELFLNNELVKKPKSLPLRHMKIQYDLLFKNKEVDFKSIDQDLYGLFEVKLTFLKHYSNTRQIQKFEDIYSTLDSLLKDKRSVSALYLAARFNIFLNDNSETNKQKLNQQLDYFKPKSHKVWKIENPSYLNLVIDCLIRTFYALGMSDECIKFYDEVLENGIYLKDYALFDVVQAAFKLENKNKFHEIIELDIDSHKNYYVWIAEKYSFLREFAKLEIFIERVRDRLSILEVEYLCALHAAHSLDDLQFPDKVRTEEFLNFGSILSLFIISSRLYELGNELFDNFNNKIKGLIVSDDFNDFDNLCLYLVNTKQHEEAIPYLEKIISQRKKSKTLILLLEAYIETKHYLKAKKLVEEEIDNISDDQSLLNLINQMARETQDWTFSQKLVLKLEGSYANVAWFWRLKLVTSYHLSTDQVFRKLLRSVPLDLAGGAENICWIANEELKKNQKEKARIRVKHLWRSHVDNTKVEGYLLALFNGFILRKEEVHPLFDEPALTVLNGVEVEYKEGKNTHRIKIDISEDFPETREIIKISSTQAKAMLGKRVGDKFSLERSFGFTTEYEITKIKPILLAVFHDILAKSQKIDNPFDNILSMTVDTESEDGITDFINMVGKIAQKNQKNFEEKLDLYSSSCITIPLLARILSHDIVDIIYGWPLDNRFPMLTVDSLVSDKKDDDFFDKFLEEGEGCILDILTFLETQNLDFFEILKEIPNISMTLHSYEFAKALHEKRFQENGNKNRKGTLIMHEGRPIMAPHDEVKESKILADLTEIIFFLESHCELSAVYGDESVSEIESKIYDLLTLNESATLRLCLEKKLPLVSFDAHFRALAHQCKIVTINPDDLFGYLARKRIDLILPDLSTQKLLKNRTFESLTYANFLNYALSSNINLNQSIHSILGKISTNNIDGAIHLLGELLSSITTSGISLTLEGCKNIIFWFFIYLSLRQDFNYSETLDKLEVHKLSKILELAQLKRKNIDEIKKMQLKHLRILYLAKPTIDIES